MAKTIATRIPVTPILNWEGTEGDDYYSGFDIDEVIFGFGGNDTLLGNGGNDTVLGGAGRDTIDGGKGNDVIWGEEDGIAGEGPADNDILSGGAGADTIYGGGGNDIITGGGNAGDLLFGGTGSDTMSGGLVLFGGEGRDSLSGGGTLYGGADNDVLSGTTALYGDDGDDRLIAAPLAFGGTFAGGAGNDQIELGYNTNLSIAYGGAGNDIITGGPGSTPMGTQGAWVDGGDNDDFISLHSGFAYGENGNDTIEMRTSSLPGNVFGGAGNDVVRAEQWTGINTGAGADSVELVNGFVGDGRMEGGVWRDFNAGEDKIGVIGYGFDSYAEFTGAANVSMTQSGANVIVSIDGQATLQLQNTSLASLDEDNFYFG
jgi:Ca2+-binding RTX toxin-like protein